MNAFMEILRKVDDGLSWGARVITAVSIAIQTIIMFLGVVFRYFLKSPLTWSDEIATFLMVFITFFGCYVALKDNMLAKIEIGVAKFPFKIRKIVVIISNLLVLILLIAVAYYGTLLGKSPVIMLQKTPAVELPMVWFYAIIPVTAVIMMLHTLVRIYDAFKEEVG